VAVSELVCGGAEGDVSELRYVTITRFAQIAGYTEKAVRRKIESGVWPKGEFWVKAPDGRILIDAYVAMDHLNEERSALEISLHNATAIARSREHSRIRASRKREAKPSWVDQEEIDVVYREAASVARDTGVPHDVDHVVPLRGRNVSGLHVPWNLRVIPASENRAKGNKWPI